MENFDLKGFVEQILLYFLKVFAYFDFATDEDVAGFEKYIEDQKAAE